MHFVVLRQNWDVMYYGIFPLLQSDSDSDLDSDSFPDGYSVLCRTFSTGSDSNSDPYSDGFPNGYCTHFRDGSLSQGRSPSQSDSESESDSESGSGN